MSTTEQWESGELGRSGEHAVVATDAKAAVDEALGLQLISIRLQKKLVADLKSIAEYHGIGYQPMVRDLLNRFVQSEIKKIPNARLSELEEQSQIAEENSTAPVRAFLEKRRA